MQFITEYVRDSGVDVARRRRFDRAADLVSTIEAAPHDLRQPHPRSGYYYVIRG